MDSTNIYQEPVTIGEHVKARRERLKMSQAEYAVELKQIDPNLRVTAQHLSRWENGHVTPNAYALAAMDRLDARYSVAPQPAIGTNRMAMARLIREHGALKVGRMVSDFAEQIVPALAEGIDLHDWSVTQDVPGVSLFVRREGVSPQTDPEVIALRAEQAQLAEDVRTHLFRNPAFAHHTNVERDQEVEARSKRLGVVTRRLEAIDPETIRNRLVQLEAVLEKHEETINPSGWTAEGWAHEGDLLRQSVAETRARLAPLTPPVRRPIEAVMVVNAERSDWWEDQARQALYPVLVLYKDVVR